MTNCAAGSNGVPADINTASGNVASVTTTGQGVITATAVTTNGLNGETYILTPTFANGKVTWATGATSTCLAANLCK